MACHDVRRLFRWEVEGSDDLKEGLVQRLRRATIWSQYLRRYRLVLVKPVWGGSLDIYSNVGEQFLVIPMCRLCRLRASLREAAFQRPCIRHTRPSSTHPSCALHCLFCGSRNCWWFRHYLLQVAFHVLRGSWICVGKRVRRRIHVVVCSYCSSSCRCVWDRGRLCIAL